MTQWDDDSVPSEDGPESIFVLDSTTSLGKSAFEWAKQSNPGAKDPRQWYFAAQQAFENIIAMLTSETFNTNVVVIGHVNYKELADGTTKGYASAIGSALGPIIPKYFNTLVLSQTVGSGKALKRRILTTPTAQIDLKNPAPFTVDDQYDLGVGLAELFEKLKNPG
jgi:triacylglycerol esterase/lipase EstA (alpha/beta hydrolase family)